MGGRRTSTSPRTASTGTSASTPRSASAHVRAVSSFFVGEQRVADELGPMMRAAPDEDMRIFLCTQIADEARHVAFFDRFYSEVGVLEADNLDRPARGDQRAPQPRVQRAVRRDAQPPRRPPAGEPEDLETLVEAITIYHMVIEGMLALTGQHFIIDYNERAGHAARVRRGLHQRRPRRAPPRRLRRALPARHGPPDPRYGEAIQRALAEVGRRSPTGVLRRSGCPSTPRGRASSSARRSSETRAFACQALERRLKVIGLAAVA